jgi:hypothetical protein
MIITLTQGMPVGGWGMCKIIRIHSCAAAFWNKADSLWNDNWFIAWALPISGMGFVLWASFWPRSPGISIGLLALAAGIMSIRPKMHPAEKTAWAAILIAFAS